MQMVWIDNIPGFIYIEDRIKKMEIDECKLYSK